MFALDQMREGNDILKVCYRWNGKILNALVSPAQKGPHSFFNETHFILDRKVVILSFQNVEGSTKGKTELGCMVQEVTAECFFPTSIVTLVVHLRKDEEDYKMILDILERHEADKAKRESGIVTPSKEIILPNS